MIRLGIVGISKSRSTGAYNYLLNLVRILNDFGDGSVEVVLLFGNDFDDEQVRAFEEIPIVHTHRSAAFDEKARQASLGRSLLFGVDGAVAREFRRLRLDVVFETAQFYGWRLRLPAIAWLTDFQHRNLPHLFSRSQYWRRELGFQAQVRSGRTVMVSSDDARMDCEKFYPVTRGRVHVVRFAVRAAAVLDSAALADTRRRYALPDNFFFLPNQFWIHKNHATVIQALALLKREGIDVVVAASGNTSDPRDKDHMRKLEKKVTDAGLLANFRFLGMIPMADVKALMQGCAALINPSFSEGWSTPVEEAKANGVPLVLSNLRVHQEQARGRALFFDPSSPAELAALLKDYSPRSASDRERDRADAAVESERSAERFAAQFVEVVRTALAGGPGDPTVQGTKSASGQSRPVFKRP